MSLELKAFDGDVDWLVELERSSFGPVDQMSRDELAGFAHDPVNRIMMIMDGEVRLGAILLTVTDPGSIYLESLAVDPAYRSRGYGARALVLLLEQLAGEGFRAIHLHVRASNPSRHLYERLGFRLSGEIPAFYEGGESAWFMQAQLPATGQRGGDTS